MRPIDATTTPVTGRWPAASARAAVFGVSDGLVSNVSLILGFAGGGADASVVRLAGLAGAVAGGISMAAGEWVSVSAQNELIERELEIERRELRLQPGGRDRGAGGDVRGRRHGRRSGPGWPPPT